jgi:hypothetical protein
LQKSELPDIIKKLKNDGVDPNCSDEEKVIHIWRLYRKTEVRMIHVFGKANKFNTIFKIKF